MEVEGAREWISGAKSSTTISIYSSFSLGIFNTSEMESSPTDSAQKSTGSAAAAKVVAGRKGKVGGGRASSSIGRGSSRAAGLFPVGGRSGSAAGLLPFGRGSGPATGLHRFGRGSGPAAPLGGNDEASAPSASMAASGAAVSSPIGSFAGTTSPPAGFPFPPSPSPSPAPAWWGSNGGSPASSSFQPSDPTWDKDTQGGFMRYFGNQPHNFHLVGGSSPSEVELLSEQHPVLVNDKNENVRTEKRIMWTPKEDERLMSAWIENSTDSATGADRKGEAYWGDVIKAYS